MFFNEFKKIVTRLNSRGFGIPDMQDMRFKLLPGIFKTHIISITNQKGGCAKTTSAINISAILAEEGFNVLLIDLDPQAHASLGMGVDIYDYKSSIYDVLMGRVDLEKVMRPSCIKGLEIVSSNSLLSGAQIELVNFTNRETILQLAIRKMLCRRKYDYIIFDCSPTLNLVTINALCASDSVIIPIQPQYYALEGMKELFNTIEITKERLNQDLGILGILVTLLDERQKIQVQLLSQLKEFFAELLFNTTIHLNVRLIEAALQRMPINLYDKSCRGAREYAELCREIISLTRLDTVSQNDLFPSVEANKALINN